MFLQFWYGINGQLTIFQPHNVHRIQGIKQGEANSKPLTVTLGDRPQFIVTPGVFFVGRPRMFESGNRCLLSGILGAYNRTHAMGTIYCGYRTLLHGHSSPAFLSNIIILQVRVYLNIGPFFKHRKLLVPYSKKDNYTLKHSLKGCNRVAN